VIRQLYILAFIEGFLVMAIELLSARIITPIYGSSIYVWTSVLGLTLLALLGGYYLGGLLVKKNMHRKTVLPFIIFSGLWLSAMPYFGAFIMIRVLELGLISGALVSVGLLIVLPLLLLGAVSPQLIQIVAEDHVKAGVAAGNIYAVSTFGGVISTFMIGLYFIPVIGIRITSLAFGIVLIIFPLLMYIVRLSKRISITGVATLTGFFVSLSFCEPVYFPKTTGTKVLYSSDNMFGRMDVVDIDTMFRALSNNLISQSIVHKATGHSTMSYTHVIASLSSLIPTTERNSAAIIGMAAGSVLKEIALLNFQDINVIDLDKRTRYAAETYFDADPTRYTFIEDDGRHFLESTDTRYNLIIVDVSMAEQQPYYLYTDEALALYYNRLNEGGLLVVNVIDYADIKNAVILEKIGDGLIKNNFLSFLLKDFYSRSYLESDVIEKTAHEFIIAGFKGTAAQFENMNFDVQGLNPCCASQPYNLQLKHNFASMVYKKTTITSGPFKDDCPEMEILSFDRCRLLRTRFLFKQ
jgi:spermidine synthase